jgi:hypothetical protein
MRTVFSRGHGTAELATALDPDAIRVGDSLVDEVVDHRAQLLVARRTSAAKDLLPVLVPRDLDLPATRRVVAAVGGGPHSELAALVAAALGEALSVPARMVCVYDEAAGEARAEATVAHIGELVMGLEAAALHTDHVADLLEGEGSGALLVLGAPGGSFLQRQFLGPGARLIASAPVGAVVVRDAPRRVFQVMAEPEWVGRHLPAAEAARLHERTALPVVDQGVVVGTVRQSDLLAADVGVPVGDIMGGPALVAATDFLLEAKASVSDHEVPVVHRERLVGLLSPSSIG